jgi:hypothetical protein
MIGGSQFICIIDNSASFRRRNRARGQRVRFDRESEQSSCAVLEAPTHLVASLCDADESIFHEIPKQPPRQPQQGVHEINQPCADRSTTDAFNIIRKNQLLCSWRFLS